MTDESSPKRRRRLPGPLPLLYFGLGYLALAGAFLTIAHDPAGVVGFFYHPRLLFVVHMVTLGFITSSILGALYLIGPMALHAPMPTSGGDYGLFVLHLLGISGLIGHFWIEELSGVGLSGLVVVLVVGQIGIKFLLALDDVSAYDPKVPAAVQAHFMLAFFNFLVAAFLGILLAFNKYVSTPFLPGHVLTNVSAHAHLAALGWATLMVFAAGYRLLPMFLPAAMPRGRGVWAGAVLFEIGVFGLFVTLLQQNRWGGIERFFAVVTAAGIAVFLAHVVWMKRHPRRPAKGLVRPDLGTAQAMLALGYLAFAAVLGLALAFLPTTETTVRLVSVYGICGLLGFLAQMIVGISARIVPIFSWLRAMAETGEPPPENPHALPDRRLQWTIFVLWTLGVPLLALGFLLDRAALAGAAGWMLFAAVVAGVWNHVVSLRLLWRRPGVR